MVAIHNNKISRQESLSMSLVIEIIAATQQNVIGYLPLLFFEMLNITDGYRI
jgi:hypothetical protein